MLTVDLPKLFLYPRRKGVPMRLPLACRNGTKRPACSLHARVAIHFDRAAHPRKVVGSWWPGWLAVMREGVGTRRR